MWATSEGIRVTAPRRVAYATIERALRANAAWLCDQLAAWAPAPPPRQGDLVPLGDDRLQVALASRARPHFDLSAGAVRLPSGLGDHDRVEVLERLYRREARRRLMSLCDHYSDVLGVQVRRIRISDPRTRWGSCSTSGTISLSWRLMMAPGVVAESLCAHEVAHLLVPNHSRAFRDVVDGVFAEVGACERWLSEHGRALLRGPLAAAEAPPLVASATGERLVSSTRT
jgi:predicted metal-dependent hydrolase